MVDYTSILLDYLQGVYHERKHLLLSGWKTLNNGWESDVYKFTAEWEEAAEKKSEDLILRIYPGNDAYEKSIHEYDSLVFLRNSGYPVPRVDLLEREKSPFQKPFVIMEYINGHEMWNSIFHGSPKEQEKMLTIFCCLFSRLHTLEWKGAVKDSVDWDLSDPHTLIHRQINSWRPIVSSLPLSGFQKNWDWILKHQNDITSTHASIAHWDFHPNNILIKADGSAFVIDWTGFTVTDFRFDLAWTLLLIGTYQGMQWREQILREYERQAAIKVMDLEFFDVAACLRRLVSIVVSIHFGAEKLGMRAGAEEMMLTQAHALRSYYEQLLQRTGLTIPEVEHLLVNLENRK